MSTFRKDLVTAVVGDKIDANELGPDEWFEIISRAVNLLTLRYLRRLRSLKEIIEHGDRPSGINSAVDKSTTEKGLPKGIQPNATFLIAAHLNLRPDNLPGKAEHILLGRDGNFYRLSILWEYDQADGDHIGYYKATEAILLRQDLLALLKEGHNIDLPKFILSMLQLAQKDTEKDLSEKLAQATRANFELLRYCRAVGER